MTHPVRIPADVDREDRVVLGLTARQLLHLALAALLLYLAWSASRTVVPLPLFALVALPVAATSALVALGRQDGLPLDRLLLAALRQRATPRRQVPAPEGVLPAPAWLAEAATHPQTKRESPPAPLRLPAKGVTGTGMVDLGPDGLALVAVCGTVNFALRTPTEQEALVAAFGRYLHSLTAPVQVLVRAEHLDLRGQISELRSRAPTLPHPALESAALEHADYLTHLADQQTLLRRQVLLVLREPLSTAGPVDGLGGPSPVAVLAALRPKRPVDSAGPAARRAAAARLVRRIGEAMELLGPAGLTITTLDAGQATAVLSAACSPDSLLVPSPELAGADAVITTGPADDDGDAPTWWPRLDHDDVGEEAADVLPTP